VPRVSGYHVYQTFDFIRTTSRSQRNFPLLGTGQWVQPEQTPAQTYHQGIAGGEKNAGLIEYQRVSAPLLLPQSLAGFAIKRIDRSVGGHNKHTATGYQWRGQQNTTQTLAPDFSSILEGHNLRSVGANGNPSRTRSNSGGDPSPHIAEASHCPCVCAQSDHSTFGSCENYF
jgi:hypothetical protein